MLSPIDFFTCDTSTRRRPAALERRAAIIERPWHGSY